MSFLSEAQIEAIRERFGTPVYVYDQRRLEEAADRVGRSGPGPEQGTASAVEQRLRSCGTEAGLVVARPIVAKNDGAVLGRQQ